MLKATADRPLATSIIGSLPRPSWYTENLGARTFLDAMVDIGFRDQYQDALTVYLHQQEVAGLDVVTDGDARFDHDVGGQSWSRYPTQHMDGFDRHNPVLATVGAGGIRFPRGHILHDYMEARVMPKVVGPIGRGDLQYTEMWKAAQRLTTKPVKFGTVTPELVAFAVQDDYYPDLQSRIMALSDALNAELHDLADAGCPAIQMEEPQIHMLAGKARVVGDAITAEFMVDVFNNTVKGLRDKTEVWCHTCWGNPSAQRMFDQVQSYLPGLELLDQVDADVITFETRASGATEIEAIAKAIGSDKKIAIGMIDHHTLQVESPTEVAELARQVLEHVPPERLILTSDCGMGREGMPRRHAFYKIVSLVLGANIVREEAGLPTVEVLAADPSLSLLRVQS
ncbi:MAG TPA: cobalamin-independent methionine synthase II family protein [Solirubrobacteraceae bacterium]|nr:cobalamin-independent methionine synthase II family protein [Solirubrobacteraceae bacterium]